MRDTKINQDKMEAATGFLGSLIDGYCPDNGKYMKRIEAMEEAYLTCTTECLVNRMGQRYTSYTFDPSLGI